jgi:hypothetical protein
MIKPVFIEGTTLGDTWFQLLWNVNEYGRRYKIDEGSYKGEYRLAFDDVSGFIHHPHVRPLAPLMPESVNVPPPTTDDDIEQYFAEYIMNGNIKDNEDYKYSLWIVGGEYEIPRLVWWYPNENFNTCLDKGGRVIIPNQIQWIINHFKQKGFNNEHCYLTVGYPESNFSYDIPYTNEQERKTSPCLRGLDFRIIKDNGINYLTTKVIYRSWSLYSGFCTNMGGFTLLNQYVAQELGIEPGPLSFTCKSLHCYDFELEPLKIVLRK